jgi:hypothetical protein
MIATNTTLPRGKPWILPTRIASATITAMCGDGSTSARAGLPGAQQILFDRKKYSSVREASGQLEESLIRQLQLEFDAAIRAFPWKRDGKLVVCAEQCKDNTNRITSSIYVNYHYSVEGEK